jgi:hypothetical protein
MLKKRQLEKEEEIDLDEDGSEDFDTELANQEKVNNDLPKTKEKQSLLIN